MNNQAAQTMPPVPQAFFDEFGVNADDRVWDYGRACYAAALSQTAGVPEGWNAIGGPMNFDREEWGVVIDAIIEHKTSSVARKGANSASNSDVRVEICDKLIEQISGAAMLAAAPAASGGECNCGAAKAGDDDQTRHSADCATYPDPPVGSSVSERARELLAAAYADAGAFSAADTLLRTAYVTDYKNVVALRALEQALTQQRGECVYLIRSEFGGWTEQSKAAHEWWDGRGTSPERRILYTTPQPGAEALRDVPGNDPRVDDDSFTAAVRACRSQLGACRPYDDEPEEQWVWDKLTQLESLLARGGK